MEPNSEKLSLINDAFISYSRSDKQFAIKLEKALEDYKPPRHLNLPQRNLVVFRDEADMTGAEYKESIEKHLRNSAKMIVVCSPNSRKSSYVNDEIRIFAKVHGSKNIFPVLLSGIPNNEAKPGQEEEMAFPEALCEVQRMPLATDYRDFNSQKERANKGRFESQWHTILANLYGLSRAEIEQREKIRQIKRRNITIGIVGGVTVILSILLVWALISRSDAIRQRQIALARQLAAQAELARGMDFLPRSTLLALESLRLLANSAASLTLQQAKSLLLPSRLLFRHEGPVRAITFSDEGKNILSAGEDGVIRVWDTAKQLEVRTVGFAQGATYAIFSPDGRFLAASGKDKILRVWSSARGTEIGHTRFPGDRPVLSFSPEGRYLAVLAEDGVQKWDLHNLRRMSCTNHSNQKDRIRAIAVSREGRFLATGAGEDIQVTTDFCQKVIASRGAEGGHVINMAFSPDGKNLAVGREFQEVQLFSVREGENISSKGHKGAVKWVAYDPSGTFVASVSTEPSVMLWTVVNSVLDPVSIIPCKVTPDAVFLMNARKDEPYFGVILLTGSIVSIWDANLRGVPGMNIPSGSEIGRAIFQGNMTSFAVSPDGRYLVTGSEDSSVRLWNLRGNRAGYSSFHYDPLKLITGFQGKHVLLISGGGRYCEIFAFNGSKNKIERKGDLEFPEPIAGAALSPDESYLVVLNGRSMAVIEVSTQKIISTPSTGSEVITAAFMQGGKRLVAVEKSGEISYWEVDSGKEIEARILLGRVPVWARFSGNGRRLLIGSKAGIQVWELEARKTTVDITPEAAVEGAVVSEDGKYTALLTPDHKVQIWDTIKGEKHSNPDFGDLVTDYGFSPIEFSRDGKTMAVTQKDGTVLLWDVEGQRQVSALPRQHPGPVSFSHDGKYCITVEPQVYTEIGISEIKFWLWRPEDLILDACSRLTFNLLDSEWRQYFGSEPYRKTCSDLP